MGKTKYPEVRLCSLSFNNQPDEKVWDAVRAAGSMGSDLILLPETWAGLDTIETLESPRVLMLKELAAQYKTYIVSGMYRCTDEIGRINSAVLIGRGGEIEGIYDKVYPYLEEFDYNPPVHIGREAKVFDTDFGKIGIVICFDANIPMLWQKMAEMGAQIVFWPSAYTGGLSLQAHAINHNYYIVTATLNKDCTVYDITGKEILYNASVEDYDIIITSAEDDDILITSVVLDLDRCIFHDDFNNEKKKALLSEHTGKIIQEEAMVKEGWFVLKSVYENVSVRELAKEYEMEDLPSYKIRSVRKMDEIRGGSFV